MLTLAAVAVASVTVAPGTAVARSSKDPAVQVYLWRQDRTSGDLARIRWDWIPRKALAPEVPVTIERRIDGRWHTLASNIPLGNRYYGWDTSKIAPGELELQSLRIRVPGRKLVSPSMGFWIDHIPPQVRITEPAAQPLEIAGITAGKPVAIVHGKTDLRVWSYDLPTGIRHVVWWIDSGWIAYETSALDHVFSPGRHELTAIAYDFAGNSTRSETITVIAL